jgi:hypothetical protein
MRLRMVGSGLSPPHRIRHANAMTELSYSGEPFDTIVLSKHSQTLVLERLERLTVVRRYDTMKSSNVIQKNLVF